jgi:hypothetical protein
VLGREGQKGKVARSLQGFREHALVPGTSAGLASWLDLAAVREVAAQLCRLLVVDALGFVDAEGADSPAAEAASTWPPSSWPFLSRRSFGGRLRFWRRGLAALLGCFAHY